MERTLIMTTGTSAKFFVGVLLAIIGLVICVINIAPALSAEVGAEGGSAFAASTRGDDGLRVRRSARTRQYDDQVVFRYEDEGFSAVYLVGSFNDWQPELMDYSTKRDVWSLSVKLDEGRYRYQYLVEDGDEEWEAIDPSNLDAKRDRDYGWVSVIEVDPWRDDDDDDDDEYDRDDRRHHRRFDIEFGFDDDYSNDLDDTDIEKREWNDHSRPIRRELNRSYLHDDDCVLFQRVDGPLLSTTPFSVVSRDRFGPGLKVRVGYGFRSREWTFGATMLQPLLPNERLMLRLTGFSGTDFVDHTGVGDIENSLAALFFDEDFRDYYRREGVTASIVAWPNGSMRLEAGFESSDYESMETKQTWSFAGGDFTPNPAIDEGTMRTFFAKARVGTRLNHLDLAWEYGGKGAGGDFDFSLAKATYRTRLDVGDGQYLDFRARYATALSGQLPAQRYFPVGGLGTVRGYCYQTLLEEDPDAGVAAAVPGGQRALIGNVEYAVSFDGGIHIDSDDFDEDWDDFDIIDFDWETTFFLFFDTGMAWSDYEADFDLDSLKSSAGVGLQFNDELRFNLIRTLDEGGRDTLFQVRMKRMF